VVGPDDAAGPDGGSLSEASPTSEGGPLAQVEAANPATSELELRRSPAGATMTVVVGFVGLIASLVVLGSVAEGVRAQEIFALDAWATPFLHGIASPGLDALMLILTSMGSSLVIVPLFVVAAALLVRNHRYGAALFLGVASGGGLVLQATMKIFFQRPRQQLDWANVLPDFSFPSGHTLNAFVFYVALALILWSVFGRRIGATALIIAVVLAVGVGISRIYLGYHYLTDVVGGLLAGVAWLLILGAAFRARPTWWGWGSDGTTDRATNRMTTHPQRGGHGR
jgi:membrane-associated phospholipid phosphatase